VSDVTSLPHAGPDLTTPFWLAAQEGRLVRPVCDRCGRSFFTPQVMCPGCGSGEWEYRTSTGRGRVYSHSVVFRGPDETWAVPYVLAIVDLEEGWRMLTRLVVDDPAAYVDTSLAGTPVVVAFEDEARAPYRRLPVFTPVTGTQP
jgi:uncharacterized OB-fold protein